MKCFKAKFLRSDFGYTESGGHIGILKSFAAELIKMSSMMQE